jgi:hypothetical protein
MRSTGRPAKRAETASMRAAFGGAVERTLLLLILVMSRDLRDLRELRGCF